MATATGFAMAGGAQGSMAATQIAGAAVGGIFNTPNLTTIAERGPEIVLNQQNIKDFGLNMGPPMVHHTVNLDGEPILDYVVRVMPEHLQVNAGMTI